METRLIDIARTEFLDRLEVGDIVLLHYRSSLISRLIMDITKSEWSHAGIYIGYNKLVEANLPKIKVTNIDTWLYHPEKMRGKVVRHIQKLTDDQKRALVDYALLQIGKRYDVVGIIGFLLSYIFKKKVFRRHIQHLDKFYCSELVAKAYEKIGLYFTKDNITEINPEDLDYSPFTWDIIKFP